MVAVIGGVIMCLVVVAERLVSGGLLVRSCFERIDAQNRIVALLIRFILVLVRVGDNAVREFEERGRFGKPPPKCCCIEEKKI
jgi:hypothetical protein